MKKAAFAALWCVFLLFLLTGFRNPGFQGGGRMGQTPPVMGVQAPAAAVPVVAMSSIRPSMFFRMRAPGSLLTACGMHGSGLANMTTVAAVAGIAFNKVYRKGVKIIDVTISYKLSFNENPAWFQGGRRASKTGLQVAANSPLQPVVGNKGSVAADKTDMTAVA